MNNVSSVVFLVSVWQLTPYKHPGASYRWLEYVPMSVLVTSCNTIIIKTLLLIVMMNIMMQLSFTSTLFPYQMYRFHPLTLVNSEMTINSYLICVILAVLMSKNCKHEHISKWLLMDFYIEYRNIQSRTIYTQSIYLGYDSWICLKIRSF